MKQPPCYQCLERHEGCHGNCPKYRDYRTEKDVERTNRQTMQMIDNTVIEGRARVAASMGRKRKRVNHSTWWNENT